MFQLKWNDDYSKTISDIPYWRTENDIPSNIIDFITNNSDNIIIRQNFHSIYYCGKCLTTLNKEGFCSKCQKKHRLPDENETSYYYGKDIYIARYRYSHNDYDYSHNVNYYVFNIDNDNIYLYYLTDLITYEPALTNGYVKKSHIVINNSYLIEKDGLTDLEANNYIPFTEVAKYLEKYSSKKNVYRDLTQRVSFYNILENQEAFIYPDNLCDLKNTIYKYSRLWEATDTLVKKNNISVIMLTLFPLYYPQFEYLINYHLYTLAIENPDWFDKGHNFKEIFGIDKKYLSFIAKNDFDYSNLLVMQIYPTTDLDTIQFFSDWLEPYYPFICEIVKDYKVNLKELKEYLRSMEDECFLPEYVDYFTMAKEVHLDLKEKNVLYPQNLLEAHNNLYEQIEVLDDPEINEAIKNLANLLAINKYEDDTYVIYPAASIADLVDESRQQKNCVRTYYKKIANYECQIYFMRYKTDITKSFVTIEVQNGAIVQARIKYNESPPDEVITILREWENNLIPIITEE